MKNNHKKTQVSKHYDVSFDPWLLFPTASIQKKLIPIEIEEQKITLGFPHDGLNAIIDDFIYNSA